MSGDLDIDNDRDMDIISTSKNGNHPSWHENKTIEGWKFNL